MKLDNVQKYLLEERFLEGRVPSSTRCCRDLGGFKIYSRAEYKSCFDSKPVRTNYWLQDVKAKVSYRICMADFKNINEFIKALEGAPVPIEPKELLLLSRKIRDDHRKKRAQWNDLLDPAHTEMRTFLYQTAMGKLEGLGELATLTKNLEIAAEIKEIGKKL